MNAIQTWLSNLLHWNHDGVDARRDRVGETLARADRALEQHEQEQQRVWESDARMKMLETQARLRGRSSQ